MKKQTNNILKFIFFLGLGVLLVWLTVKDITKQQQEDILVSIQKANYSFIGLSFLVGIFSHYVRAVRWKILLAPLGYQPKTSNTFFAVMVGYLVNLAVPRLGEVSRCGMLNSYEKIPFTEGFGSVIAERALDLVCLVLIFFITLFLEFDKISGIADDLIFKYVSEKCRNLFQHKLLLGVLIGGFILIAGILFYLRKKIQQTFSTKMKAFINGLWQGLSSIKDVKQPVLFIINTLLIWLMYILQVYVCFLAFSETAHLSFMTAAVLMVFGSLAIIVVPGGTGVYQTIVITILTGVYLISQPGAFAFAWTVWTSQIILIAGGGLISLLLLDQLNKKNKSLNESITT